MPRFNRESKLLFLKNKRLPLPLTLTFVKQLCAWNVCALCTASVADAQCCICPWCLVVNPLTLMTMDDISSSNSNSKGFGISPNTTEDGCHGVGLGFPREASLCIKRKAATIFDRQTKTVPGAHSRNDPQGHAAVCIALICLSCCSGTFHGS